MKTRYPIILVHGLAIIDTVFRKSWGKIDEMLISQGYTVFRSKIDGFGTIESNAAALKNEVLGVLKKTNAEKVNIIAHSKGGLDSKYMIKELGMAKHVASLTTLCTPHHGSPVATGIMNLPKPAVKVLAAVINVSYRALGDKNPDSYNAGLELMRVKEPESETLNIAEGVMCQSFSATVPNGKEAQDFVMAIPVVFSRFVEKDRATDGLVPRDSAIFGNYKGDCLDGSVSHTEIVDFLLNAKKREKILGFYSELCRDLAKQGF